MSKEDAIDFIILQPVNVSVLGNFCVSLKVYLIGHFVQQFNAFHLL